MRLMLTALSLALAAPLIAQMPTTPPGAPDPARAVSGSYTVDTPHTQLLFTVNHLGFTEYTGEFTNPTGTLTLDTKSPAASKVEITFPIDQVRTTVAALDTHLKSADFFDAAKFPEGKFVSTKVVAKGQTATITGDLTLKGVTKPVVLQARFFGAGTDMRSKKAYIGFAATTVIKRSEWGITYAPTVSDEVKLTINAGFKQN
ncbi:YceI family protein [Sphingomonas sp. BIUV-7]|uniref:YceI family protein n=1 Tax=Sphingomonas natans TaxID=3063330 RepID=A0ABT8Y6V0_9SPHN|nr:YceI family protein [Sphingomonas sp. BIUV-7]MDO6413415.1 YceI family protein [Sphingomonas sp. BIUV-7]